MLWFLIALIGYLLLAIAFVLDKFILSESVDSPVVYTFYSTIFMFGAVLLFPLLGFAWLAPIDMLFAMISGLAFGFGLWAVYIALSKGESSHIQPFSGAVIVIVTFLLASFFLGETLSIAQKIGVGILVFASFLLSFEKTRNNTGFHSGFIWATYSGALFAISHVSAKYLYTLYEFWPAFIWTRATTGFVALLCLLTPAMWKHFNKKKKKTKKSKPKANHPKGGKKAKTYAIPIIIFNKIFAMSAVVLIQYAAAIGSVTLVTALAGLQYAFLFILILLLTKFTPKLFKEYFTKQEVLLEWVAIILVVLGSVLFVF